MRQHHDNMKWLMFTSTCHDDDDDRHIILHQHKHGMLMKHEHAIVCQ